MSRRFGWLDIARLGLVQAALGSITVLTISTLNRVMVVEWSLPALLPGALVALHYVVQVLRPRFGYGSDAGGRRTPWIVGGMMALAVGGVVAAAGTAWMGTALLPGVALATLGFLLVGLGAGAAGTSVLVLVAARADARMRAPAATILWLMMIAGIVVTAGAAGALLDPFTPRRLVGVAGGVALGATALALLAVWRVEGAGQPAAPGAATPQSALQAVREIWAEPHSRRFTQFVFVSMLAYSAQEMVLEPFAGAVFHLTPGETAGLTGLLHAGVLAGMAAVALCCLCAGAFRGRAMRRWTVGGCCASAVALAWLAAMALTGPVWVLRPAVLLLGVTNGAFAVSAIGAMMGLAGTGKSAREGTRVGLWGAAQALAFAAGGLFGTGLIDAARGLLGTPGVAYAAVFGAQAAVFLLAARLAADVFHRNERTQAAPVLAMPQAG